MTGENKPGHMTLILLILRMRGILWPSLVQQSLMSDTNLDIEKYWNFESGCCFLSGFITSVSGNSNSHICIDVYIYMYI